MTTTLIYAGTRVTGPHGENYKTCHRCGTDLGPEFATTCADCRSLNRGEIQPFRQQRYPALPYTVTVFAPGNIQLWYRRTELKAFGDHQIRHALVDVEQDWVSHHYATDVLGHYTWPVITITDGANLIDHWEGHQPDRIAAYAPAVIEVAA
jgi:hypothetical protein